MKNILKYALKVEDKQYLQLPLNSRLLSVEEQRENIVLYALVDDEEQTLEKYLIIMHGTGHRADDVSGYNFLGTVQLKNGALVFHIFCIKV